MELKSIIKKAVKVVLPDKLIIILKRNRLKLSVIAAYNYDFKRYFIYSDTNGSDTAIKLIGKIIREYHVIEKGLTMPQSRLGFGKDLILSICSDCVKYIANYGTEDEQLKCAIGVIYEYKEYHDDYKYELDANILSAIENLKNTGIGVSPLPQRKMTKEDYFSLSQSDFKQFSNSRSSIRNYTDENITEESLTDAFKLARNTPSACNRQSWRTYTITEKTQIGRLLEIQGGNRGFGHLTNKLIVVTGEVGVFSGIAERNQVFIDGGMYAMNLLYALHYYKIAACILNCSTWIEKDIELRKSCKIKDSEVFIAMIACGIPPETFMIASSKRYEIAKTNKIL